VTEDKSRTDTMKTKHNPDKTTDIKYRKTKLAWFSCFLRHSARKRGGLILQRSQAYRSQSSAHNAACCSL